MRLNIVNAFSEEDEELTLVTPPAVDETATTPEASEEPPMLADDAEMKPKRKGRPTRIGEISALAEKNRHVYRMSDGTLEAVYTAPPAEYDPDEVDDEPIPEEDGKHYRQRRPHFTARFSRDEENDELFSVEQGEYRVTVSAKKKKRPHPHGTLPVRHENALVFKGVKDGTDYEYAVRDDGVKENIIVKKPAASYAYAFLLHCKGLHALLSEDATRVSFVDGNKTEIFHIPAPFMTDAEGVRSEALSYALEAMDEDTYTLTVTADKDWMNDEARAFPVTIDPQILLSGEDEISVYGWTNSTMSNETVHTVGMRATYTEQNDGDGSGSSKENAIFLPTENATSGSIDRANAVLWYKIKPAATGCYTIYTTGSLDTVGELYDACSVPLRNNDDYDGLNFGFSVELVAGETYYLKVRGYNTKTGAFTLYVSANYVQEDASLYIANRMYMRFAMPTLPSHCRVKRAELTIQKNGAESGAPLLGLYKVTGNITTGYCVPAVDTNPLDICNKADENGNYTFDITAYADALSKGEITASALMLRAIDESATANRFVTLDGSTVAISLTYENNYAVGDSYRVHTHEIGRFGQGSVDLAYGNLMLASDDFVWSGNRMPVTVKHLFNSALAGYTYTNNAQIGLHTASFIDMKLGYGFRLNLMQSMVAVEDRYVQINENGEERYFTLKAEDESSTQFVPEDGGDAIYDAAALTLTEGDISYSYDEAGRLIRQVQGKNTITITYANNRIFTVTDSIERTFTFGYDTNGYLTSITAPDQTQITYSYTNDLLTGVTYPDNRQATITYGSNKPTAIVLKNASGTILYQVTYTYSNNRVTSVTEYGEGSVQGATTAYSYSAAARRTIATTTEAAEGSEAANVIKTVYTFDDDGNIVSEYVYSEDTGNVGADGEGSGIHPHSGEGGAGIVSNINNLLVDHGFDEGSTWTEMPNNGTAFSCTSDGVIANAKFGRRSLCMVSSSVNNKNVGVYQATNTLPAGDYTFSAYLRVASAFSGTDAGAFIRVTDTSGNILGISERLVTADSEYTRLSVPFTLATAKIVQVQLLANGNGTVYADGTQLENNPYANAYNMMKNGNFERGTTDWGYCYGVSYSASTRFNMSRSLSMNGDPGARRYAYQPVIVCPERSTRETFTLSGWAKGYALPVHDEEGRTKPTFRLRAVVKYKDESFSDYTGETFTADFSPCTEEWQLASVQFSKSKYRTVESIEVYCDYDHNSGTAYFDDIQLVRSGIETGLSAEDFATEPNDTESSAGSSVEETPETTAATFEEAKDEFDNILTETTFTDGELGTIYRAFGFSEDGNDLLIETDARGNETAYTVDATTSRNEEATDRCGNKTAYEYDDSGRTTKVTSKNADGAEIAHVSYSYDAFDNMTEIARGDGMKYVVAYNAFHNLDSIGIEGKTEKLIKYTYKNGNGRLKQMTYANGHTMKAVYNSIGQMVAEKWFETEAAAASSTATPIAHYKYVYDGDGNIVRSIDFIAKKEYTYEYEEGKILRATEADITVEDEVITSKAIVNTVRYYYDGESKMTRKVIAFSDGTTHTVYYETNDDKTVVKFTAGGNDVTSHSKNDSFGRKIFDELQLGTGFVSREFDYHKGEVTEEHVEHGKLKSSPTTQLVSKITLSDGRTIEYEYDAEERITSVVETYTVDDTPVTNTTIYTYDALGQLLTERRNGHMINSMTYDTYGNILSKNGKLYAYDTVWRDLLLSVDGEAITYDAQGNPTTYLGHTLTWEKGRQLKSYDSNTYTYNANGIRTSKTVNGVTHTYTLDGTKILREVWGDNTLIPLYDNEDNGCGILYNDTQYYFLKNLQGDVIAIADKDANNVARYSYDAWGGPTILSDATGVIANINPFRYRGYYYDVEIGLYYLQSRYYDSVVGRFVDVDTSDSLQETNKILENNLFAYCQNDPVNESDYTGSLLTSIIKKILTGVFKGLIGQLGLDFITFLYRVLLVDKNTKLDLSPRSEYLKAIASEVVSELLNPFKSVKLAIQVLNIIGSYLSKIINNKMTPKEWVELVLKIAVKILASYLLNRAEKKLSRQQKSELEQLRKYRKKKSRNLNLKNQKKQIKLEFEKKGFKVSLKMEITEYVIGIIFSIL